MCNATTHHFSRVRNNPDGGFKNCTELSFLRTDQFVVCIYILKCFGIDSIVACYTKTIFRFNSVSIYVQFSKKSLYRRF